MKAYSVDLRKRMIAFLETGHSIRETAQHFIVSPDCVFRLKKRYEHTQSVLPKKQGGWKKPKIDAEGEVWLKNKLAQNNSLTLAELCELYDQERSVCIQKSAMHRTLQRLGITFKKSFSDPKQDSERVQKLTEIHHKNLNSVEPNQLIFIDETGANLNLAPAYGWAPSTERAHDKKPTGKGKRVNTIGALSDQGIVAAMIFEGTLTTTLFLQFLMECLCPLLTQGHVVVMDNATQHKAKAIRELIEVKGARLVFLPPYSPHLNPIEMGWSKVKQFLRRWRPRTVEKLVEAFSNAVNSISSFEAISYFNGAGYCY